MRAKFPLLRVFLDPPLRSLDRAVFPQLRHEALGKLAGSPAGVDEVGHDSRSLPPVQPAA